MPKGSATRGESAAFINRMLEVIVINKKHSLLRVLLFFNMSRKGVEVLSGIRNESGGDEYI